MSIQPAEEAIRLHTEIIGLDKIPSPPNEFQIARYSRDLRKQLHTSNMPEVVYSALGWLEAYQGNYDAAVKSFSASIEAAPFEFRSYVNFASALMTLGYIEEAAKLLIDNLAQFSNSPEYLKKTHSACNIAGYFYLAKELRAKCQIMHVSSISAMKNINLPDEILRSKNINQDDEVARLFSFVANFIRQRYTLTSFKCRHFMRSCGDAGLIYVNYHLEADDDTLADLNIQLADELSLQNFDDELLDTIIFSFDPLTEERFNLGNVA